MVHQPRKFADPKFEELWQKLEVPSRIPDSAKEYVFAHYSPGTFFRFNIINLFLYRWHYNETTTLHPKYVFTTKHPSGGLNGVILFAQPSMNNIYKQYSDDPLGIIELRRMACITDTTKNLESRFISQSLRWLAKNSDEKIVVTYADAMYEHVGGIYRASNFIFDCLTGNPPIIELSDGRPVHDRSSRTRTKNGQLSHRAAELVRMLETGEARHIISPSKSRYHYHLDTNFACKTCLV